MSTNYLPSVTEQPGSPLTLTKSYKGLELKQPVRLLDLSPTQATLQATDSMFSPLIEGSVYLQSQEFTRPIAGHIQDFQPAEGIFHLEEITEMDWLARQSERVQPKEPTYIRMHGRYKTARLCLYDLSVLGMGVVAAPTVCTQVKLTRDQVIKLEFTLAGVSFTNLVAKVLYQVRLGQWLQKLGLSLMPTVVQRRQLEQYVASRKA